MRARGGVIAILSATVVILAGAGTAVASAAQFNNLDYHVTGLAPSAPVQIYYTSGVDSAFGGTVVVSSGSLLTAGLTANSMFIAARQGPLAAEVIQFVSVGSAPITGTASIPAGASVSVTDGATNTRYALRNGAFSFPSGVGAGSRPPRSGTQTIRCRGTARACTAQVSLAGGAVNRKLVIRLSDTNLRLRSVDAVPASSRGAYLLSGGHYALGGSEYIATLNAVRANPKGAHLVLKFAS